MSRDSPMVSPSSSVPQVTEILSNPVGSGGPVQHSADTLHPTTAAVLEKSSLTLTDQTNLLPFRKVLVVFSSLSLCILVSTLDSTIVATSLPTISNHFNAGSIASWVPSAYFLTSTAFQPLCKRLSLSLFLIFVQTDRIFIQMVASVISSAEKRRYALP